MRSGFHGEPNPSQHQNRGWCAPRVPLEARSPPQAHTAAVAGLRNLRGSFSSKAPFPHMNPCSSRGSSLSSAPVTLRGRTHLDLAARSPVTRGPKTPYKSRESLALLNPAPRTTTEGFSDRKRFLFCFSSGISEKAQPPGPLSQKQPRYRGGSHWPACTGSIPHKTVVASGPTFHLCPADVLSNWGRGEEPA